MQSDRWEDLYGLKQPLEEERYRVQVFFNTAWVTCPLAGCSMPFTMVHRDDDHPVKVRRLLRALLQEHGHGSFGRA